MEDRTKKKNTEELKKEIEILTDKWKRALADYQNLERRNQEEKAEFVKYANSNLILKFCLVFNHLETATDRSSDQGLKLIFAEFKKVFDEEGVEEIKCEGEIFNPELMEAVEVIEGKEENENKVAEVVKKGYLLKGKLLLPASVKVFKAIKLEEKNINNSEIIKEGRPA